MSGTVWPIYRRFAVRDLRLVALFASDPTRLLRLLAYLVLLAVYAVGITFPIPGLRRPIPGPSPEGWWFVSLLDLALTGGALGRGAIFCLGVVGPLALGGPLHWRKSPFITYGKRLSGLAVASLLVSLALRSRGLVAPGLKPLLIVCGFAAFGGLLLNLIDVYTVRLHGPQIRYINLALVLWVNLRSISFLLQRERLYWAGVLLLGLAAFVCISAYMLVRAHILIKIERVGEPFHRWTTLEIPTMNEPLLDTLSVLLLSLYVSTTGTLSILFGWHSITARSIPSFSLVALAILCLGWAIFLVVNRFLDFFETLGAGGAIGFSDAQSYAKRMLNNFWIIPGLPAGRETEAFIKSKLAGRAKRSFLLFAAWFASVLGFEYILVRLNPSDVLFPFGSVVFIFVLVMLVANLSAVFRHVNFAFRHFMQLLRGESRLLDEMYPLMKSNLRDAVSLDQDLQQYWEAERFSDQLQDLMQWLKLAREVQFVKRNTSGRIVRLRNAVAHLAMRTVFGIILSFVVLVVCLLAIPHLERKDMALILLPTLLTTVLAPEAVTALIKRKGKGP
jgi:hypothetical protein